MEIRKLIYEDNVKIASSLFIREHVIGDKYLHLCINRGYDKEMGYLGEFALFNDEEIKALYKTLKEYCKINGIIKFKNNKKQE